MDDIHLAYTYTYCILLYKLVRSFQLSTNTAALSELKHVCGSSKLSKVFVV